MKISTWKDGRKWYAGIEMRGILAEGSTKEIAIKRCRRELDAEEADIVRADAEEREIDSVLYANEDED